MTLQQIGRAGRDRLINAMGVTYLEPKLPGDALKAAKAGTLKVATAQSKGPVPVKKRKQTAAGKKTAGGKSKAEDDDAEGRFAGLDEGLQRLVLCHARKECVVAEFNRVFGSPGDDSHEACLEANRRLSCSSCSDKPPFSSMPVAS